jgi:hypothetical protein
MAFLIRLVPNERKPYSLKVLTLLTFVHSSFELCIRMLQNYESLRLLKIGIFTMFKTIQKTAVEPMTIAKTITDNGAFAQLRLARIEMNSTSKVPAISSVGDPRDDVDAEQHR